MRNDASGNLEPSGPMLSIALAQTLCVYRKE
jgi:hypothetical protein